MTPPHLTRLDALDAWNVFLPRVKEYAARRDRLLTEGEVIRDTLGRYSIAAAEKWLQGPQPFLHAPAALNIRS